MGIDANWHVADRLSIAAIVPDNGGCVILTDGSKAMLTLFLGAQWISLYRALPLSPNAWVGQLNRPHIYGTDEIKAWVAARYPENDPGFITPEPQVFNDPRNEEAA